MRAPRPAEARCRRRVAAESKSCFIYSFHVCALRLFRTSPGGRRFPNDHSKVIAQMRVIHKSTPKRDVAQRHIGLQHVFGSQFDATPDHKGMGRVPKCGPEGARKVRFAAPHQSTQICDKYATGDMPVDIVEDLPYLPCQQTLFSVVRDPYHRLWIKLSSQQPSCLEYRAVRGLFLVKVTSRCLFDHRAAVTPDWSVASCPASAVSPLQRRSRSLPTCIFSQLLV
jgi:hypothetical protein